MAVMRLKGLNKVTVTLATGKRVTYWYAWKGGPRLDGQLGTPEFIASFWARVGPPDANGCRDWMGARAKSGHGQVVIPPENRGPGHVQRSSSLLRPPYS